MSNQTINQELWRAAEHGQWQKLPSLFAAGGDVHTLNEIGSNALHLACQGGCARHLKTLKALLAAGADPNGRRANGYTPLHHMLVCHDDGADGFLDRRAPQALIDAGADVSLIASQDPGDVYWGEYHPGGDPDDLFTGTVYEFTQHAHHSDMVAFAMQRVVERVLLPQWVADGGPRWPIVRALAYGTDPNSVNAQGRSLLALAADQGDAKMVRVLAAYRAADTLEPAHENVRGAAEIGWEDVDVTHRPWIGKWADACQGTPS
jgi:hypothetical protein